MSSRNAYLGREERAQALVLSRALQWAASAVESGQRQTGALREGMLELLSQASLAEVEYVELVDAGTLQPVEVLGDSELLVALAVRFGRPRLIDSCAISPGT